MQGEKKPTMDVSWGHDKLCFDWLMMIPTLTCSTD